MLWQVALVFFNGHRCDFCLFFLFYVDVLNAVRTGLFLRMLRRCFVIMICNKRSVLFIMSDLLQSPNCSSLKIISHSFQRAAPHLWNNLPPTLHVPYQSGTSSSPSSSPSLYSDHGLVVDFSHGVFHCHLKTFLFSKSFLR